MKSLIKYGVALAVVGAVLAGAYAFGYSHGKASVQAKWDASKLVQVQTQNTLLVRGIDDSYKLGLQYEYKQQEVRYVVDTQIEKIKVYMPDVGICPKLPAGFGRLHTEATATASGDPAFSKPDGQGSAAIPAKRP